MNCPRWGFFAYGENNTNMNVVLAYERVRKSKVQEGNKSRFFPITIDCNEKTTNQGNCEFSILFGLIRAFNLKFISYTANYLTGYACRAFFGGWFSFHSAWVLSAQRDLSEFQI